MLNLSKIFEKTLLGVPVTDWSYAIAAAVVTSLVIGAASRWLIKRLEKLAGRTDNNFDDVIIYTLKKTRAALIIILSFYVGLQFITLSNSQESFLKNILLFFLLIMAGVWGSGLIGYLINSYVKRQVEDNAGTATTVSILGFLGKTALWAALFLVALDNFGIDITALVAGLGIGGIAVALAAQNVLADAFASIAIALDKPFAIGDFIIIDDYRGTVERIGLKTTRIRSLSGEQLIFSNTDLLSARIRNYKQMQERRILFEFGIIYQTSSDVLTEIPKMVQSLIDSEDNTRFDRAHFKSFGASSLDFEVVYYMRVPDYVSYMDTQQAINLALFKKFESEGIEFAYPTQTLFVTEMAEELQTVSSTH